MLELPDSFITASGRKVTLGIYVEPGKEDRCAWAMNSLKRAMRWDEERFGREYDLDLFSTSSPSAISTWGRWRTKSLNIFNDKLVLARPDTVFACDTWHAMTSDRVYRRALPVAEAAAELRRVAGTQLDPGVVAALLAEIGAAHDIAA